MHALGTHVADAKMGEHHLPTEKKKGFGYRMSSQVTCRNISFGKLQNPWQAVLRRKKWVLG